MVLSCADARLRARADFGAGLGDLYTVRSLGAVVDRSVLASLEIRRSHLAGADAGHLGMSRAPR